MENLTDDELVHLINKHIGWIHAAEAALGRRLTNDEAKTCIEMLFVHGWQDFVEIQNKTLESWHYTQHEMSKAMENFIEGVK